MNKTEQQESITIISTKKEFKEAIDANVSLLAFNEDMHKTIKRIKKFYKLSDKKKKALILWLSGLSTATIATIAASLALAPATGGASAGVAALVGSTTVAGGVVVTGASAGTIATIVIAAITLGIDSVIKFLRRYDIESVTHKFGPYEHTTVYRRKVD